MRCNHKSRNWLSSRPIEKKDRRTRRVVLHLEELETRALLSASSVTAAQTAAALGSDETVHPLLKIVPQAVSPQQSSTISGSTPQQIQQLYGLDQIAPVAGKPINGAGETIAIVDSYYDPHLLSDVQTFNTQFGIQQFNVSGGPTLTQIAAGGGAASSVSQDPTGDWPLETSLDVEWAHAMAPQANIVVVEAADGTDPSAFTATQYAATEVPGVVVVSMSWGDYEFSSETGNDSIFMPKSSSNPNGANPGVTFVAASGDSGAVPIYPAVSPYVLAAGGSTLGGGTSTAVYGTTGLSTFARFGLSGLARTGGGLYSGTGSLSIAPAASTGSTSTYPGESGWSGSGGGPSAYEGYPSYQYNQPAIQQNYGYPYNVQVIDNTTGTTSYYSARMTPDVAYDATGYAIYDSTPSSDYQFSGGWDVVDGTSAAAPQWSALIALADQQRSLTDTSSGGTGGLGGAPDGGMGGAGGNPGGNGANGLSLGGGGGGGSATGSGGKGANGEVELTWGNANSAIYTTPGTSTWTSPITGTVKVQAWGGGGGGSGGTGTSGGYGGGGGGYATVTVSVIAGDTYTLFVGGGSNGGSAGANGTTGGTSTFALGSTTYLTAWGGGGGKLTRGGLGNWFVYGTGVTGHYGGSGQGPQVSTDPSGGGGGGGGAGSGGNGGGGGASSGSAGQPLDTNEVLNQLYNSLSNGNYAKIFHDITTGSNGYSAATGYDLVTGLGTPIANELIPYLASTTIPLGQLPTITGTGTGVTSGSGGTSSSLGSTSLSTSLVRFAAGGQLGVGLYTGSASLSILPGSEGVIGPNGRTGGVPIASAPATPPSMSVLPLASSVTSSNVPAGDGTTSTPMSTTSLLGSSSALTSGLPSASLASNTMLTASANALILQDTIVFGASGWKGWSLSWRSSSLGLSGPAIDEGAAGLSGDFPENGNDSSSEDAIGTDGDAGGADWFLLEPAPGALLDGQVSDSGEGSAGSE